MNRFAQLITLNSFFQFENLLKYNLHSWCGTVWRIAETIHVLTVFLNSKLLFSTNLNFCWDESVLLPSKNSGPFHHALQPDNATISIPIPNISRIYSSIDKIPLSRFCCCVNFTNLISYKRFDVSTWILYPVQNINAVTPENRLFHNMITQNFRRYLAQIQTQYCT